MRQNQRKDAETHGRKETAAEHLASSRPGALAFTESDVESAALAWLEASGWRVAHGPDIAPDMPAAERFLKERGL